jgi:molybdopterin molybdotransferase
MVSVKEAEQIVLSQAKGYGCEWIAINNALGNVLAEDIKADRDLPSFNRVTMDGIAIVYKAFERGLRHFKIKGIQTAGEKPIEIQNADECIEIMTGAVLPHSIDTVIRYEDILIKESVAEVLIENIKQGQNVHFKGRDKKQNEIIAAANQVVNPALISVAASVGAANLLVKKLPRVLIVSTGDELVEINKAPGPYQIRSSNKYVIEAALQRYRLKVEMMHLRDDMEIIQTSLSTALQQYDVVILTGGVSKGRFDFVPDALERLSVQKLFHQVKQKPGKPFWFGSFNDKVLVFAFPGNPVSTFLCLYRYFIPWLEKSLGIERKKVAAILNEEVCFTSPLHYFLPVQLNMANGKLLAAPVAINGSGDYANLLSADAFMELPLEQNRFQKDEVFPVWLFSEAF